MKKTHTILLLSALVIIVFISVILYRAYTYFQRPYIQAFSLIPDETPLFIKGREMENLLVFNQENPCFSPSLFLENQQNKLNYLFNNILLQEKYRKMLKNASPYLFFQGDAEEQWGIIFETFPKYNAHIVTFMDSLLINFKHKSFIYKNNNIYVLSLENELLYLNHQNGALLMTFSENIMRQAINKFTQPENTSLSAISTIPMQRNENAKILVFVQYKYFIPYVKNKIRKMGSGDIALLDMLSSCQWSVFEAVAKKKNIILSGYTSIDTTNNLSKLLIHKNNNLDFTKILPCNANRIFSIKASKSNDWKNIKYKVQPNEDFFTLMYPTQILGFEAKNDTNLFHYLAIKSENTSEASFHLYNSLRSSFADNNYILDTFYIGSLFVGSIDLSNFVLTKLGITSHLTQLNYYTLIGDYFVFTDKKNSILFIINQLRENKTWENSSEYKKSQQYFTQKSNLFYYTNYLNNNRKCNYNSVRMQLYATSDTLLLMDVLLE